MTKLNGVYRLQFIDSLRGIAALYVLIFHMVLVPLYKPIMPNFLKPLILTGNTGVTLFFIISAFTLYYTLSFQKAEPRYLANFYIRRIFRIVPLYYLWLIFMVVFKAGQGVELHGYWANKSHFLMISMFGYNFFPNQQEGVVWASWTLGVEMVFYMFFPLIFRFVDTLKKAIVFLLITSIIALIHYFYINNLYNLAILKPSDYQIYFSLFHQLPVFGVGIITYFLHKKMTSAENLPKWLGKYFFYFGIVLFLFLVFLFKSSIPHLLFSYLVCIPFVLIFFGLSLFPAKIVVNKFLMFYGTISFSLYLNHPLIVFWLSPIFKKLHDGQLSNGVILLISYIIALSLVTIISLITFRFVEKPFIELGKKLIKLNISNATKQREVDIALINT